MADTPAVLLVGARQSGKSTLAHQLQASGLLSDVLTLDHQPTRELASRDPAAFVQALPHAVAIDEIQRVPQLMLALKESIDQNRAPGRFFLTGSANILTLPKVADALVGRMEIHRLYPLSQGELGGQKERFLRRLFSAQPAWQHSRLERAAFLDCLKPGFFPEARARSSSKRRAAWFDSYAQGLIERDLRDIANVAHTHDVHRLLRLVAARPGALLSYAALAKDAAIPVSTLKRYLAHLKALFLVTEVPPWHANIGKRLVKSPKIYVGDVGLAMHLGGDADMNDDKRVGGWVETFVVHEILKQLSWFEDSLSAYHYRSHAGEEVDLVLQTPDGRIAAIEIKASATLAQRDGHGLRRLQEACGDRFVGGVLLYAGMSVVPMAPSITAVPMENLWT